MVIVLGIAAFTLVALLIVSVLLFARSKLVNSGSVKIIVNGDESQPIECAPGSSLLATLADKKIFIRPSGFENPGAQAHNALAVTDDRILQSILQDKQIDDIRREQQQALRQDLRDKLQARHQHIMDLEIRSGVRLGMRGPPTSEGVQSN